MAADVISVLPLLVVILVSLWTKQVLVGLGVGVILGAWLISPGIMPMLNTLLTYLYKELLIPGNLHLLVFLYLFGAFIGLLRASGGIQGFIHWLEPWTKTRRRAYGVLWLSSLWTAMAPDFRILAMGPLLARGLAKDQKDLIRSGVVLTATATPLAAVLPIGTIFVGYMVGLCAIAAKSVHYTGSTYSLFLQTIPFNFFAWAILLLSLWQSFFYRKHQVLEQRKQAKWEKTMHQPAFSGEWGAIGSGGSGEHQLNIKPGEIAEDVTPHVWHFVLPMLVLWALTLVFTYISGIGYSTNPLRALLYADASKAMMQALIATLVITVVFLLIRKETISNLMKAVISGGNEMMPVLLLLILVWAVAGIATSLGFTRWVTSVLGAHVPHFLILPMLFLASSVLSYFLGSTFGVWGLLLPIAISLTLATGTSLILTLSAIFAGGTLGGFASPLSDNTATLALVLDKQVMELTRPLLIPSLIAGGAALVGFFAVGWI